MNCKPGDLAIVVTGALSAGRIVRAVRLMQVGEKIVSACGATITLIDNPQWLIEGHVYGRCSDNVVRLLPAIRDKYLRPLRDPGDDATDETLLWLPVPSKQKETA